MLENSICWTTPRFEGTDRERHFSSPLSPFLNNKPVVLAFVELPEFQAAYPNRLDNDEDYNQSAALERFARGGRHCPPSSGSSFR